MVYKFYNLSDISFDDCKKVFWFCLNKCNFLKAAYISNYDNRDKDYLSLFTVNNIQVKKVWHLDYHIDYEDNNKMQAWRELFEYSLEKSDVFYFCVPAMQKFDKFVNLIKTIPDIKLKNILKNQNRDYYEIYGLINEDCKNILLDLGLFDSLQSDIPEWRFKLISSYLGRLYFVSTLNFIGSTLTDDDLEYFENKNILLGEKLEDYLCIYGKVTVELMKILMNMFTNYIDKLNGDIISPPYFVNLTLCINDREIFFNHFEESMICLSDLELEELINNYKVDTSKWNLYKETSTYQAPMDYFSLRIHDLW